MPLIGNALKPLAKSILIILRLTAAAATDAAIHKKMFESNVVILIISNEKINVLLIKFVSKIIKNEAKGQKDVFFVMLFATLGAIFYEIYYLVKEQLEQVKAQLEKDRILDAASTFNKF